MYYLGNGGDMPVKPVTRRVTFTRGQHARVGKRYLQRKGRTPLNRIGYPTMGTPISASLALEPGGFAGVNDPIMLAVRTRAGRRFETRPYDPASSVALGASDIIEDVHTRSGRRFSTMPYNPRSPVFGASILDPISLTTSFVPSLPSVVAAPVPQASSVWNPITSLLSLWNDRPQVLKDIRLSVNPNQVMQAAQSVVSPNQVSGLVSQLRAWGINPSYQGLPVTGPMAGAGYQVAGMNLGQYLPWIAGGAALLFLAPMLMGRK